MGSLDYSSHHSNLTDLGEEQLSPSASSSKTGVDARSDDSGGQGEEESVPEKIGSIAGFLHYTAESTKNPSSVSETTQNHSYTIRMSGWVTKGHRKDDHLDL